MPKNNQCVFCEIIKKKIPADIIFEDNSTMAFYDINPKAPIHILIIPKQHIESIQSDNSENIVAKLIKTAKLISKQKNIKAYKLLFNVGKEAGQVIGHLHMHLLAKNNK